MTKLKYRISKKWLRFIPMITMMIIIFAFSAQPDTISTQTSDIVVHPIFTFIKKVMSGIVDGNTLGIITVLVRKTAHFMEYAIFGVTVLYAFYRLIPNRKVIFIVSEAISILYAASDEIHQAFVPGRYPGVWDVVLDGAGAAAGIVVALTILKHRNRKSKTKKQQRAEDSI